MGRCRQVLFHGLFRIVLRQPFFHLGPFDAPYGIGLEFSFLDKEIAVPAEGAHVKVHRPGLQAPFHQVRLIFPQPGRDEIHGFPAPGAEVVQRIGI